MQSVGDGHCLGAVPFEQFPDAVLGDGGTQSVGEDLDQVFITDLIGVPMMAPIDGKIAQHGTVMANRRGDEVFDVCARVDAQAALEIVAPVGVSQTGGQLSGGATCIPEGRSEIEGAVRTRLGIGSFVLAPVRHRRRRGRFRRRGGPR